MRNKFLFRRSKLFLSSENDIYQITIFTFVEAIFSILKKLADKTLRE